MGRWVEAEAGLVALLAWADGTCQGFEPVLGQGGGLRRGFTLFHTHIQSISQSLALSWRVSSDVSKGKERNGCRKGKLKSDFIEWTERRGEGRWREDGISYMRPEGSDDIWGVQIKRGVRERSRVQSSERARYKTAKKEREWKDNGWSEGWSQRGCCVRCLGCSLFPGVGPIPAPQSGCKALGLGVLERAARSRSDTWS